MNIEQLREEIAADEGCVYEVYLDHLGLPTFGIGHLVLETDEEFVGMKEGVDHRNWNWAADEMVDSRWYKQVTNRAERLVQRMRNV